MTWLLHWLAHWFLQATGTEPRTPSTAYNFWSGFGSDLGELTMVGAVLGILRSRNCEVHGCWRVGRHATLGNHNVCRRHHPDGKLTHQDVLDAHDTARGT